MPSINNPQLTLTAVNNQTVTINVTYNAVFSALERRLSALGLVFRERIAVLGVDSAGPAAGELLLTFPNQNLTVTDGAGSQTVARNVSRTVDRSDLQEDEGDDEISCRIRIEAIGLPPSVTPDTFTGERAIGG